MSEADSMFPFPVLDKSADAYRMFLKTRELGEDAPSIEERVRLLEDLMLRHLEYLDAVTEPLKIGRR